MLPPIKEKPRICFYGLYCYPLFNPEYNFQVGGWETRMTLVAKELARRGNFNVTMIVADYGQPHIEYREGVQLISWIGKKVAVAENEVEAVHPQAEAPTGQVETIPDVEKRKSLTRGIEGWLHRQNLSGKVKAISIFVIKETLATTHNLFGTYWEALKLIIKTSIHSVIKLLDVLKEAVQLSKNIFDILDPDGSHVILYKDIEIFDKAQADIYVVPGNHRASAVVASYCQLRQKKYVFLAGSDYDYYLEYKTNPKDFDIYGESYFQKAYAIERASLHVVQTPRQANMLSQGYGRNSVVIRNPIDLNTAFPRSTSPASILWVGKAEERVKRPSLAFELARRLPDQPFVVILNKAIAETYARCLEEARSLPNVVLIERVPFDEVEKYFAAASLFVSTSVFEGFPNTFLQAAKYGVPIVSTDVDPGGMLSEHGSGIVCGGNFECFVKSVQHLITDSDLYTKISAGALNYVRTYHDKDIVIAQYEKAFREVLLPIP
jgi:glycosyltransferase involved in cell wall biosynthesis